MFVTDEKSIQKKMYLTPSLKSVGEFSHEWLFYSPSVKNVGKLYLNFISLKINVLKDSANYVSNKNEPASATKQDNSNVDSHMVFYSQSKTTILIFIPKNMKRNSYL